MYLAHSNWRGTLPPNLEGEGICTMDKIGRSSNRFLRGSITWGVVTLIAISLASAGKLNMNAATWVLWLAFCTALFGVYRAER